MERKGQLRLSSVLIPLGITVLSLLPLGGWEAGKRTYHSLTDIGWNNTVSDYHAASVEERVRLDLSICTDGKCILPTSWACGFTTDSLKFDDEEFDSMFEAVDSCFDELVSVAPNATLLDVLRKTCGEHYMVFDPRNSSGAPEKCERVGGLWGVKEPPPLSQRLLLLEAGIQ